MLFRRMLFAVNSVSVHLKEPKSVCNYTCIYDRASKATLPAPARIPTETFTTRPSEALVGVAEAEEEEAEAAAGLAPPLVTAALLEGVPALSPAFALPIDIGKPGWPAHWPLKKPAKAAWSVVAEQAFGSWFLAALMMGWFLQMQLASVKAHPEEETAEIMTLVPHCGRLGATWPETRATMAAKT